MPLLLAGSVACCLACATEDPAMLAEMGPMPEIAPSAAVEAGDDGEPAVDAGGRLPAGLYFRHVYGSCADCPTPRAAVVARILATPDEAEHHLARAGARRGGYPFAAHTDELGIDDDTERGIAIVTGLYASVERARHAIASDEVNGAAFALLDGHRVSRGSSQLQVLAIGDRSTRAYASPEEDDTVCIVPAHRLFLLSSDVLSHPPAMGPGPARLPVTCDDGAIGYVDITSTLYFTTVLPDEGDGVRLLQTVDVACDTATIHQWPLRGARRVGDGIEIQSCP